MYLLRGKKKRTKWREKLAVKKVRTLNRITKLKTSN